MKGQTVFTKGKKVVKLITGAGWEVAAVGLIVAKVSKKGLQLAPEDRPDDVGSLLYDAQTGREINPVIPGVSSRIVVVDGQ